MAYARLFASVISIWLSVGAGNAAASDLDVTWSAPNDCADREGLRAALARRLGRDVTFGGDAPVHLVATVEAMDGGYELELTTRTPAGSEERRLQARGCGELVRVSLLIAELLLSAGPERRAAAATGAAAPQSVGDSPSHDRPPQRLSPFARLRAVGDLGSLADASVGPGLGLGLRLGRTRIEVAGLLLPSQDLSVNQLQKPIARMQLLAASASVCQEFFSDLSLAPCLQFEAGRLSASGQNLRAERSDATVWLMIGLGARMALRLLDPLYLCVDASAGLPLSRPILAIEGVGVLHRAPAVVGRLELSLEVRL